MLCLSQQPDDVVQINVYGATLAGMLNKGVNIHSFLSTNGFGDCVIFDVPRRDIQNRPPFLISSLRDAHHLRSLIEGAEEVKPDSIRPSAEAIIRTSTAYPGEVNAEDPLINCTLSTIAGDARQTYYPDDEDMEENEVEPSAPEEQEEEEEERTPIAERSRARLVIEPMSMDSMFPETFDLSYGDSVVGCLVELLAQVCTESEEKGKAGEQQEVQDEHCPLGDEPAIEASGIGTGGGHGEQQLGEVQGGQDQVGDELGLSILKEFEGDWPEMSELGLPFTDLPVAMPESPKFDIPEAVGEENMDLQNSDSTLLAACASPWSDDDDEFFDCPEEGDSVIVSGDSQKDADDLKEAPSPQKTPSTGPTNEGRKVTCQYCKEVLNWRPHYGKTRFLNHVRKHCVRRPIFKCQFCSFMADQDHKVRYHHRSAHSGVRYQKALNCESEQDMKNVLKWYHECFPGFPAPIRYINVGKKPLKSVRKKPSSPPT